MSWKLLIVLVLFTIALGNVNGQKAEEEAEKVEQGKEKEQEAQKEEQEAQKIKEQEAQKEKEEEAQKVKEQEAQKEKEQEEQKEKEEQAQKEKEAQKLKEQEAQKLKEKESQKNTGCCKEDLLVTCDGTNTGLKKEGSTEAEKENVCTSYHSWTAQKGIFGCYKKEKKEEAKGRIWPFTSSTVNAGSTAKLLTNPTQEQELWKQEKGTNGIWYKAGIYHLGEEEGKFQTMAKAMLKNTCLKAGETWNYWGDNKWYKNNGVVIKCGC